MLTFGVAAVNAVDARVFGLPFLIVWIGLWVLATPLFLYAAERTRRGT